MCIVYHIRLPAYTLYGLKTKKLMFCTDVTGLFVATVTRLGHTLATLRLEVVETVLGLPVWLPVSVLTSEADWWRLVLRGPAWTEI